MEKRLFKQIMPVLIANIVIFITSLITTPLLINGLGQEKYGLWVILTALMSIFVSFTTLGFDTSVLRFAVNTKEKTGVYSLGLIITVGISTLISIILVLTANQVSEVLFKTEELSELILLFTPIIIFGGFYAIIYAYLRAREKFLRYSLAVIIQNIGMLIIIVIILKVSNEIKPLIINIIILNTVIIATLLIKTIKTIKLPNFQKAKEYFHFGIYALPTYVFSVILAYSNNIIIGVIITTDEAAIFALSAFFSQIVHNVWFPLGFILFPMLTKKWENQESITNLMSVLLKYVIIIFVPLVFGISMLGKQGIMIVSNENFLQGVILIPLLCTAQLFNVLLTAMPLFTFSIFKKTKYTSIVYLIGVIIFGISTITLTTTLGIVGSALATLISYVTMLTIAILLSHRYIKIKLHTQILIKTIISSVIMSISIVLINPIGLLQTIITIILGLIIYSVAIIAMGGINKKEIKQVLEY